MPLHRLAVPAVIVLGALSLGVSACGSTPPGSSSSQVASAATASEAVTSAAASETDLTVQEKFAKDVMVPKDLDLSGLVMPEEVRSNFADEGRGAAVLMETYIKEANSIPELNKGSHINTAADYPLFEKLRPLMIPEAFEALRADYVQPGGSAMIHNYANDGSGFNILALGRVHPDDNGPVWQWNNEKAVAGYLNGNGAEGVSIDIPVRFSFNTSDKGVVSLYAKRTYQMVGHDDGSWQLVQIEWSAADTRSSQDSAMLLEAESPIDAS